MNKKLEKNALRYFGPKLKFIEHAFPSKNIKKKIKKKTYKEESGKGN